MQKKNLNLIVQLRHHLHMFPELSLNEYQTKETLIAFLKEHTDLEIVDRGLWFYGFYKCNQPEASALAFRADFDALPIKETITLPYGSKNPGISHKCGHDGHSAALAGLALEINDLGTSHDIYFIFQHGEEIGAGGEECAKLLTEKKISRVFAFHNLSGYPEGSILVKSGVAQCASKGLTIGFTGTPAHASQPEDGKNPSSAIAKLALEIQRITSDESYDGMVLATIVQMHAGSKNFGIAASAGELSVTLRGDYERDMGKLEAAVRKYAGILAQEENLTLSFTENDEFPETVNDEESIRMVHRAALEDHRLVIHMTEPFRASEDFGYYLKKCPGAIFYVGNGEGYPELHTFEYDFNDLILEPVVEVFKKLSLL